MSDLELAKVKLVDTIGKYNLTASNIAKFKFSQLEENVFATMMVEFAMELANGVEKNNKEALTIPDVSNNEVTVCPRCRQTKLNTFKDGASRCKRCGYKWAN